MIDEQPLQPAPSLPVMALLAQGLPVAFVPEEPLVASVRNDMVDHRRRRQYAALQRASSRRRIRDYSPENACGLFASPRHIRALRRCPASVPGIRSGVLRNTFLSRTDWDNPDTGRDALDFWALYFTSVLSFSILGALIAYRMSSPRWLYTESPPFRFFIALSSAMTSATAPSTFSVDFSLSILILPAGSVRT